MHNITFTSVALPTGHKVSIPDDIDIRFPNPGSLPVTQQARLAYIPWSDTYLKLVPPVYRPFFAYALPYMHARTTDIHTALSVSELPFLLTDASDMDIEAIYVALILHDIGWSKVNPEGIVASLSYSGVAPTKAAEIAKRQHILYGEALALELLADLICPLALSDTIKRHITEIIRRHDHDAAWEAGRHSNISPETLIVCDADRLWSYTHENFWLDTIRKNVTPGEYLIIIEAAIDGYFFTAQGRSRARQLLQKRQLEVDTLCA